VNIKSFNPSIKQEETNVRKLDKVHLIVLVHGFQGNSNDMRTLKNCLSVLHPEVLFLCSKDNEENTENDIEDMGKKLAKEINEFISEWCSESILGKISFLGHSLGGIIVRAALPYLEKYKDKMWTFVTLSCPHLGYMYASNTIMTAGMWLLKQWKKSKCLAQLTMTDTKDSKESYLYKLSQKQGFNWFKNVFLISSYQDRYVPVESARIEVVQQALEDERYYH
jgi:triacylglycerol esterase/lipase EstA (alpha/beta hydrolase family)